MSKIDKIKVGETTYNIGANADDIEGLETIQYSTMPTASADNVGKIVQYTGTTDTNYTNGLFYKCELVNGSYVWNNIAVQLENDTDYYMYTSSKLNWGFTSLTINWLDYKNACVQANKILPIKLNIDIDSFTHQRTHCILRPYILNGYVEGYEGSAFMNKVGLAAMVIFIKSTSFTHFNSVNDIPSSGTMSFNITTIEPSLATNNTSSYTPTNDYNPATKKYVDDHSAPSGVVPEFVLNYNNDTNRQTDFSFFKSVYDYCNDKNLTELTTGLIFNGTSNSGNIIGVGSVLFTKYISGTITYSIVLYLDKSFRGCDYQYYQPGSSFTITFNSSNYTIDTSGHITFTKEYWTPSIDNLLLSRNNEESYTPTNNYNPATKKYVDDKAATKQDTLTAGTGIDITDNVISSTGGVTFTNSSLGVIKGSSSDGYVNANNDGTGNINGWESIKSKRVFYSNYASSKCFCQCYSFVSFDRIVKSLIGNSSYNKTIATILSDAQNNYDTDAYYNFVYIDFMDKAHTRVSMTLTLSSNPSSSTRYLASTIVLSAKQDLPPSFGLAEIYFTYNNEYTVNSTNLNADNVLSFLSTNNTTAYNPTSDYHPATKKYVDDSVSAIAVPTKTSDLTNDSGFLTSIPNAAASVTGGIKMRYDATTSTLYIRNDGTDA